MERYLSHHGIKGMKWGVRRFQNPDGTLTEAGKKRYRVDADGNLQKLSREERREIKRQNVALARKQSLDDYTSGKDQKFLARASALSQMDEAQSASRKSFEDTDEGRSLHKEYTDRWTRASTLQQMASKYEDDHTFVGDYVRQERDRAVEDMNRTARRLAQAEGHYLYDHMVQQFGDVGMQRFMNDSWYTTRRDYGEDYADWLSRELYEYYKDEV